MKFDELTKSLRRLKVETGSLACLGCGHEHSCGVRGCAIITEAIAQLQTSAKYQSVRHGHWIEEDGCQICSNCGEEHAWAEYRANYCDVCGAKMDEVSE